MKDKAAANIGLQKYLIAESSIPRNERLQHVEPSRACDDCLPFAVGRACASALASLCEMKLVGDIAVEARHQHIRDKAAVRSKAIARFSRCMETQGHCP